MQDRQHQILISNLLHQKRQKSDNPTTSDHYYTSHESNYYNVRLIEKEGWGEREIETESLTFVLFPL